MIRLVIETAGRERKRGSEMFRMRSGSRSEARVSRVAAVLAAAASVVAFGCPGGRHGRILEIEIPAPSLEGSRFRNEASQPAVVYLPPSYDADSTGRYPVLYHLPGFTTSVDEYIDGSFDGFELGEAMDRLIAGGGIAEMIVVIPNGRNFLGGSFYLNSSVTGRWEDHIASDVTRFVDSTYRTIPDRRSRAISGESMGGFGAFDQAMKHPDVYSRVYAMSPGLFAPGGLDQAAMATPDRIDARLMWQSTLDRLPEKEAEQSFRSLIAGLQAAERRFPYHCAFGYAYGAAFSPDPDGKVPWISFPWRGAPGDVEIDARALAAFENGFGGWEAKLAAYGDNLRRLAGIVIDYGKNDSVRWIPGGCEHVSGLLRSLRIEHELRVHDGGHVDRWRERFEEHLLPFVSHGFTTPVDKGGN